MALHNEIGKQGEELAVEYLIRNEYKILEKNWRFKKSEIDIIAKKEDKVVFIEVKTRTSTFFQEPEKSVTLKKQKMIFIGANQYAQNLSDDIEIRFDIVSISLINNQQKIKHIKDAFYPII
jgi:putative endonuclease